MVETSRRAWTRTECDTSVTNDTPHGPNPALHGTTAATLPRVHVAPSAQTRTFNARERPRMQLRMPERVVHARVSGAC
jgi:hypothetical protein